MSIEELLKPRYKVIADYPQSPFAVNEIIEFTTNEQKIVWMLTISGLAFSEFDNYPRLFKKLKWHEERRESEMPEYIKCKFSCNCVRINFTKDGIYKSSEIMAYECLDWFLPATEEEYIQYNKTKSNDKTF